MNRLTVDIKEKAFNNVDTEVTFTAIKNLQLELSNNEFICIVGPSGCGKTTLLNIIAGLDLNFDGSIQLNDEDNSDIKTSFVFQTPRLLPWRTVLENIQLAHNDEISLSSITDLLRHLGLSDNIYSFPQHLSLGMQRRVALARAFSVPSNILLMDEPFVSLDQPTARKARQLLLNLWQAEPRNVIFVTHDLNEAIELADRVLFLSESPSSVIADIPVDIPREKRNAKAIEIFTAKIQHSHQQLTHLI
ncbi:MAG: nitrate/sulfonate/bicarbonate ABC transporter ATP-binding protein [Piscirickettsiaceae bacterium]|nr:MAG: nitrate/sulfonate/bicarbonate ABC transporter ATP-binding protein [Piscirickettsiaceae bacterium]